MNDPVENISERVLDVREIEPRIRHTLIFQLFEHLDDLVVCNWSRITTPAIATST